MSVLKETALVFFFVTRGKALVVNQPAMCGVTLTNIATFSIDLTIMLETSKAPQRGKFTVRRELLFSSRACKLCCWGTVSAVLKGQRLTPPVTSGPITATEQNTVTLMYSMDMDPLCSFANM